MEVGAPLGNQNAAKSKRWQKALERALAHAAGDVDKGLEKVAQQVVTAAIGGDSIAWKEIGDRMDGKAVQSISGADGGPVIVEMVRFADKNPE